MARSSLDIANRALAHVGSAQISSLDEADNEGAEQCNAIYDDCRDEVLERAPFPDAIRRTTLTAYTGDDWDEDTAYTAGDFAQIASILYLCMADSTGNSPDESPSYWQMVNDARWAYAYRLPDDMLPNGLRNIGLSVAQPGAERPPFEIRPLLDSDGQPDALLLLTDDATGLVEYVMRATNIAFYPASLSAAISYRMAHELALSLRKDHDLSLQMLKLSEVFIGRAIANAENSEDPGPPPQAPHIAARWG